jgi:hypothetical protein
MRRDGNEIRTTRIGAGRSAAVRSMRSRSFVQADPPASLARSFIIAPRMGNDRVLAILRQAKSLARDYYRLTGKPLGVTGEVAEYEAAHILRIELTPARQADYDAIERRNGSIRRLQIKGRCLLRDCKPGQRFGRLDRKKDWDAVVMCCSMTDLRRLANEPVPR